MPARVSIHVPTLGSLWPTTCQEHLVTNLDQLQVQQSRLVLSEISDHASLLKLAKEKHQSYKLSTVSWMMLAWPLHCQLAACHQPSCLAAAAQSRTKTRQPPQHATLSEDWGAAPLQLKGPQPCLCPGRAHNALSQQLLRHAEVSNLAVIAAVGARLVRAQVPPPADGIQRVAVRVLHGRCSAWVRTSPMA